MPDGIEKLDEEIKALESKLEMLPKQNSMILRIVAITIIGPLIGPYFPMKNENLAEKMGYRNALLVCIAFFLIIGIVATYMQLKKVRDEIHYTKVDIEYIKKKKMELEKLKQ